MRNSIPFKDTIVIRGFSTNSLSLFQDQPSLIGLECLIADNKIGTNVLGLVRGQWRLTFVSTQHDHPILMTNGSLGVTKWVCRMKHISEIIQLEALVIRIVCVWCVDTNERTWERDDWMTH
jgi:hypothetical protein